jgi:L-ascorbate metabolism protein UlaG (beta-lactamase superfamily)
MKKSILIACIAIALSTISNKTIGQIEGQTFGNINIQPLLHSSMHMTWNKQNILIDPYQNEAYYKQLDSPELILITDIHGDHLNLEALGNINTEKTKFIVPQAVADILYKNGFTSIEVLSNGGKTTFNDIEMEAVPMYNLPEDETSRHTKGRGNGYIITIEKQRLYISGDTEDIPEMRELNNIDIAFVCMNLPYTMDVQSAASAVLDFKPKIVFPFHYRGAGGKFSDVTMFKELVVDGNDQIEVRLVDWYQE